MCGKKENVERATRKPSRRSTTRVKRLEQEKEDLQNRLEEIEEQNAEYLNHLRYLQADYENSLKRAQREIERISHYGSERLIIELLEILDELELASLASENRSVSEEVKIGVRITLEKLRSTLAKEGLEAIECENQKFDPDMHQAISKEYSKEHREGIVLREVRKGYLLKGKVIRPSTVVVSSSKSDTSEE
jgi:molecular chaperone GrpE